MRAQGHRLVVLGIELLDDLGPQQPSGPHLGHFHEVVHADGPEERQPGGKGVDVHPGLDAGADVFQSVGQGVAQFQIGGRTGFLHVVTGDRDAVELRHFLGGVGEDVADDADGGVWRINIGVPHHVLFQNVVLNSAGQLLVGNALLLRRRDVERHHRQHRAVHGHRHRHLVERDAAEQDFHVQQGIDRHAGLADIAHHARMVEVVAAMGRQIERDGQALLPGGQVAAIEGVGLLGGGETGVLAHRPRLGHVHRRIGAAQERRHAGDVAQMLQILDVVSRVQRFDVDVLHGRRDQLLQGLAGGLLDRRPPVGEAGLGKVHAVGHRGEIG